MFCNLQLPWEEGQSYCEPAFCRSKNHLCPVANKGSRVVSVAAVLGATVDPGKPLVLLVGAGCGNGALDVLGGHALLVVALEAAVVDTDGIVKVGKGGWALVAGIWDRGDCAIRVDRGAAVSRVTVACVRVVAVLQLLHLGGSPSKNFAHDGGICGGRRGPKCLGFGVVRVSRRGAAVSEGGTTNSTLDLGDLANIGQHSAIAVDDGGGSRGQDGRLAATAAAAHVAPVSAGLGRELEV